MGVPEPVPINYRELWDVPRIFFASHAGQLYLFDCPFDEALEDYPETYHVFQMPPLAEADYAGSWADLWKRAERRVGVVPIRAVRFDPTRRKSVGAEVFDLIHVAHPAANGAAGHATAPAGATGPAG